MDAFIKNMMKSSPKTYELYSQKNLGILWLCEIYCPTVDNVASSKLHQTLLWPPENWIKKC